MRVAGRVFGRFGWDVVKSTQLNSTQLKAMQEWMREAHNFGDRDQGRDNERGNEKNDDEKNDDGGRKGHARTKQRSTIATINLTCDATPTLAQLSSNRVSFFVFANPLLIPLVVLCSAFLWAST